MFKHPTLLFLICFLSLGTMAQEKTDSKKPSNKGSIYAFWGWNRSWYSHSDIHFTGDQYNFTLNQVKATDRQSPFGIDPYFNLGRITIPQTNVRAGYFINDHYDISIGYDHMKYVVVQHQFAKVTGTIRNGSEYDGNYNGEAVKLDYEFLIFEHTDGLNYIDVEFTRNDDLLELLKIPHNYNKIQVNTMVGIGSGVVFPRSNVTLLNGERYDEFHVAGYGFSTKAGLNITLLKHLFFRSELKYGFINMPDIRTSPSTSDKASQHFLFIQSNFCFGYTFNPFKN